MEQGNIHSTRLRWAAIGAAVAVTLGFGGIVGADAQSAPTPTVVPGSGSTQFVPITPVRILDTRGGVGAPIAKLGPNATLTVSVTGRTEVEIPASATAVALNVTVTGGTEASFLTVFAADATLPPTSNINWAARQEIANALTTKLSGDGKIKLFNKSGSVEVIADIVGYHEATAATGCTNQYRIAEQVDGYVLDQTCVPGDDEPNDTVSSASLLDDTAAGTITPGDTDVYTFTTPAVAEIVNAAQYVEGSGFYIELRPFGYGCSGRYFRAVLRIRNAAGELIYSTDESDTVTTTTTASPSTTISSTSTSIVPDPQPIGCGYGGFELPNAGTYTISVSGTDPDASFSYTLYGGQYS